MNIVRTPSMSTFDSLELGRCSDDGRDTEERVAGIYNICTNDLSIH